MKLIVISLPRGGTYLTSALLTNLGVEPSKLHLQVDSYTDYRDADAHTARFHPEKLRVHEPIEKSLELIGENEFAVGHIQCNTSNRQRLAGWAKLLLVREVRSALVSYFTFLRETARQNAKAHDWFHESDPQQAFVMYLQQQGRRRVKMYEGIGRWFRVTDTPVVRFKWLRQGNAAAVAAALNEVDPFFADVDEPSVADALTQARGTKTITKADNVKRDSMSEVWSDDAEALFAQYGGPRVNVMLDYPDAAATDEDRAAAEDAVARAASVGLKQTLKRMLHLGRRGGE